MNGNMGEQENSSEKQTLSDYAYEQIAQALLSGRLKPGEKITLRQLMAMLDTSSTPIRDAIRQLSVENAIDFAPNRHIRVPLLTSGELRELRDIRVLLEGRAVEIATGNSTPEFIGKLRQIDDEIRATRDVGDIAAAMERIQRFHFTLYDATRQTHLINLIRGLWLRTAPYRSLLFPDYSSMERGNLRLMIIDAMKNGDGSSAKTFIQADITGAMNYTITRIQESEEAGEASEEEQ